MPTLGEQLDRLARRGPTADPDVVLRRAESTAAQLSSQRQDSPTGLGTPWQLRAAVGVVGLAGVASLVWIGTTDPSDRAPEAEANGAASSIVVDVTAVSATPTTVAMTPEDAALLANLYGLLDVGTRDEVVTAFSTNVPQRDVAQCMTNAGFEYVEGPSPQDEVAAMPEYNMSAEEFAATLGLGVASQTLGLYPSPPDPNLGYLSLPAAEQERYGIQLYECSGGRDPERNARSEALSSSVTTFRALLDSDSRVIAATATWRECLAAKGFEYDAPMALRQDFYTRLGPLDVRKYAGENVDDELRQLLNDEIAVAVANVPCQSAYEQEYRSIVLERFSDFKALWTSAATGGNS